MILSDTSLIFVNQAFIVADKPAGVLSVPGRGGEAAQARAVLGLALQQQFGCQIYPVHRLDLAVSGLLLYAREAAAHARANAWFEHHQVRKTYRAWTESAHPDHLPAKLRPGYRPLALHPGAEFEWRGRIIRNKRRSFIGPRGKPSHTLARYLGTEDGHLRWDVQPLTGRPHQLRLDLSRHGCPVLGDALYGAQTRFLEAAIALRAWRLDFSAIPAPERLGLPEFLELAAEPPDWRAPLGA